MFCCVEYDFGMAIIDILLILLFLILAIGSVRLAQIVYGVGETGLVVPTKDSQALSNAWGEMLTLDVALLFELSAQARRRVIECFSIVALLDATEQML